MKTEMTDLFRLLVDHLFVTLDEPHLCVSSKAPLMLEL
jgi:hypothetical protein